MSAVNLKELGKNSSSISLTNEAQHLAGIQSLAGFSMKSDTEMEEECKAKEQEIEQLILVAEKTCLCFMVDCTGSMYPWIDEVKQNIKIWSEQLHARHTHMELHVAFVRYTDYDQPEDTRTTMIDFTTDLDKFHAFVDGITTPSGVGGDTAEDVFGGLDAALRLKWPDAGTKVLIHITDAPCHGETYHDSTVSDRYPRGDPGRLDLDDLIKQFVHKSIAYYFGYIDQPSTATMIKAFNASMQTLSRNIHSIQEFDASDPSKLLEGVLKSVTSSITATFSTLMLGGKSPYHDYTIDKQIPNWDEIPLQVVFITPPPPVGSAPKVAIPSQRMKVKIAPQPFDEGAQKIVYHALDVDNDEHIVLKRSKRTDPKSNSIKRCLESAQIHATAANFAANFNRKNKMRRYASEIQFAEIGVMQVTVQDKPRFFTYEQYLGESNYTKFNTNFHYIPEQEDDDQFSKSCQAFSHYSWEMSGKKLVICDLQGVKLAPEFGCRVILTDPAIHTTNVLCHGSTNLGQRGIERFFRMHKCNDICYALKLKHPNFEEREP